MIRRPLLLAGCVVFALALAGLGLLLYGLREGVANQTNYGRIKRGMSRERVERLLGGPGQPDLAVVRVENAIVHVQFETGAAIGLPWREGMTVAVWRKEGRPGTYVVVFDGDGHVANTGAWWTTSGAGFLERLVGWFGQYW